MLTLEKYSLVLLFYAVIGLGYGLCNAYLAVERKGEKVRYQGAYLSAGAIALVYGFLGLGVFGGGHPIYIYVPVLLIWWGGSIFGSNLFPLSDRGKTIPIVSGMLGAVVLYHTVL